MSRHTQGGRTMAAKIRAMARIRPACFIAMLACHAAVAAPPQPDVGIETGDVERFYAVLDAAGGLPSAQAIQQGYLDPGTAVLRQFAADRSITAEKLAKTIARKPELYQRARDCAREIPQIGDGVRASLAKLRALYPDARFVPVTVVVATGSTGGSTTPAGVVVGLETMCRADWLQPDLTPRFVHLIAHEYAHVQQPGAAHEAEGADLAYQVLLEGGAELVGRLTSGQVNAVHLQAKVEGRECEFEREFAAEAHASDYSRWLYNGVGDAERPGDLGYWIGHRIATEFYARATDKPQALRQLLQVTPQSAGALIDRSGWRPCARAQDLR